MPPVDVDDGGDAGTVAHPVGLPRVVRGDAVDVDEVAVVEQPGDAALGGTP